MSENGRIDTIEREESRIIEAKINVKDLKLEEKINIISGDAVEILPTLNEKYDAICLECQFVPNGINVDNGEEKAILDVGEVYHHMTRYSFRVKEINYYE